MPLQFHQHTLSNGLTIIGEHNPAAQSVAAGYFVNTGSRDEVSAEAGVSHFLEHMMFKGTDKRSAEAINREFDELGARYNAYTNEEHTVYYGAVLPERGAKLLDLLSDMMRPALRQSDFDMEKKVILEEIAMYDDRPNFKVFERGGTAFFGEHPAGNSVLGSSQSIRDLSREQMLDYFQRRYAANNLTLSIAGKYDWQATLAQIEELTAQWQSQASPRQHPKLHGKVGLDNIQDDKVKRVHIATFATGLGAQDENRYAANILSRIIGLGSGSRLYWALLDNGLADAASFSHSASDRVGAYYGYISTSSANYKQVMEIFQQVLAEVQRDGVSSEEWQRAQRTLATGVTLGGETPMRRLMSLGVNYLYNQDYRPVSMTVERIMKTEHSQGMALLEQRPFANLYHYILEPQSPILESQSPETKV